MLQVNHSLRKHYCVKDTKSHATLTTQTYLAELKVEKKNTLKI